jgi:AraC-like DNA-binding protein
MAGHRHRPDIISRHSAADRLGRHRHREAYVAVVLAGSYLEAGDGGRIRAEAGTVIAHQGFTAHRDEFGRQGAVVLNLPALSGISGAGMAADVDLVARAAERDHVEASHILREQFRPSAIALDDWPDMLALALTQDPDQRLTDWADMIGLDPASVSRGFARAYGVSPKRFRLEARVRRAVGALESWEGSLATVAAEHGFADQAHFTRAVRDLTGSTPHQLRAKSVQSGASDRR